ncbi:microphthalmia-associated transcription factor isoform X1 [Patella vulgata]|uniref:microphthalmia-associated transcription factor isoform X1 n=1 Tax=Patella vulgata TaxID=6465 RepID=UPI00217F5F47|nr:microphthalmia-associated transcription factor isoform X1 [Patella vulgata]
MVITSEDQQTRDGQKVEEVEDECLSGEKEEISEKGRMSPTTSTVIIVTKTEGVQTGHALLKSLLKNKKNPGRIEKIKIIKSPITEIKNATMPSRTNLRQELERQQFLHEEKQLSMVQRNGSNNNIQSSEGIQVPNIPATAEIPSKVYQVKTLLQHPTKYYVQQSQKRQVQDYLSKSQGRPHITQSLPTIHDDETLDLLSPTMTGSAPVETDPVSSDMDSILNGILSFESSGLTGSVDSDLHFIEPTLAPVSSTLPYASHYSNDAPVPKSSSSCPAEIEQDMSLFTSEEDAKLWVKDRQKKDTHNMIERRRRFNINDRIKELGTLLPRTTDPDMRQNKGTILKASVDYIRRLKRDQDKMKQAEEKNRMLESNNRKLLLRMQQLDLLMKSHGMSTGMHEDVTALTTMVSPNTTDLIKTENHDQSHCNQSNNSSQFDILMEDSSPVSGDPMLMSNPVSPFMDDTSSDFS